jgi:hypothetical protein
MAVAAIMVILTPSCQNKETAEKLLLGGSGWSKVVIIDKESKAIEWEYPLEKGWECNSVVSLPGEKILFTYSKGARVVNMSKETIWDMPAPEGTEMQTARLLPDGNILLAWSGHPMTIMEVTQDGELISKCEYETGIETPHGQIRRINKSENGNYLVTLIGGRKAILSIDKNGTEVDAMIFGEGNVFTVEKNSGNQYWVALGDANALILADIEKKEVIKRYNKNDIEGTTLFFVAGLYQKENGNLYVTNWQGHDKNALEANAPQLFELNAQGEIVWSLNDNENFGMISAIDVIK